MTLALSRDYRLTDFAAMLQGCDVPGIIVDWMTDNDLCRPGNADCIADVCLLWARDAAASEGLKDLSGDVVGRLHSTLPDLQPLLPCPFPHSVFTEWAQRVGLDVDGRSKTIYYSEGKHQGYDNVTAYCVEGPTIADRKRIPDLPEWEGVAFGTPGLAHRELRRRVLGMFPNVYQSQPTCEYGEGEKKKRAISVQARYFVPDEPMTQRDREIIYGVPGGTVPQGVISPVERLRRDMRRQHEQ